MALIEFNDNVSARRAELNGFPRKGKKSIEAGLEDLQEFLEDEDKEIEKVALRKRNGDQEAEIIDAWIQKKREGKHRAATGFYTRNFSKSLNVRTAKVFKLQEDSLTVYRQFENVLFNQEYSEIENPEEATEEFEEAHSKQIEALREEVEDAEEELEQAKEKGFEEHINEAV